MTLEALKPLAVKICFKEDDVGWSKCCPPNGNKPDIIDALLNKEKLNKLTVDHLKTLAEDIGVKEKGVGWDKCCPPTGLKADIIAAIAGEASGYSSAAAAPVAPSEAAGSNREVLEKIYD